MSATLSNPLLDTDAFPPSSHQSYSTDDQELNELYAQKKPPSTSASSNHRLLSFDALRGLIMCIMAWDHSRDYISDGLLPKNSGSEFWNGPLSTYDNNPLLFLQRWLPHFCAPGFFWLMGIGMVFLTASRIAKGWSYWRIMRHFCIRGFLLLFLDRVVNLPDYVHLVNPSSFNSGSTHAFGPDYLMGLIGIFEVLTALGWTMIVCGLFMPMIHWASTYRHKPTFLNLGQLLCFLLALLSLILSNIYIRHYQDGDPLQVLPFPRFLGTPSTFWEYILRFLLIPGVYEYGIIAYPLIPWISLCFWGMAVGFVFLTHNGKKHLSLFSFLQFLLSLIIFISLRTWGGDVGNFRGWHVDHLENEHWILVYLDVCKYPPSPAYIFMTMAGNSLILCLFTLLLNYFQSLALSRVEEQEHFQYLSDHFSSVSHAQPIDIYTSFSQSSSSSYVAARSGSKRYISNSSMIGETHLINVVTATRPSVGSMAEAEGGEEEVRKTCCSDYSDGFAEFKNWPFLARVIFYPLLIFGRVPLFFYVVHWLWLGIGCLVLHSFSNGLWMGYVPIWWFCLLVVMFFLCIPYSRFKDRTASDSLWRLL